MPRDAAAVNPMADREEKKEPIEDEMQEESDGEQEKEETTKEVDD